MGLDLDGVRVSGGGGFALVSSAPRAEPERRGDHATGGRPDADGRAERPERRAPGPADARHREHRGLTRHGARPASRLGFRVFTYKYYVGANRNRNSLSPAFGSLTAPKLSLTTRVCVLRLSK